MFSKSSFLAIGLLLAGSSLATAQDLQFTGVVGAEFMGQAESYSGNFPPDWWESNGTTYVGAINGKLGVVVSSEFSMQFDAWLQSWKGKIAGTGDSGSYAYDWDELDYGSAAHFTYHSGDYLAGVAVGLGGWTDSDTDFSDSAKYATVAVEGGYDSDQYRIVGQAGVTVGIAGHAKRADHRTIFGSLVGTYYLTPNFSVSAHGTLAKFLVDEGDTKFGIGAEVRYKPDNSPVILSAGYHGNLLTYSDGSGSFKGVDHRFTVGLSIPFGAGTDTLRDLDRTTGLSLTTPYYGLDAPK